MKNGPSSPCLAGKVPPGSRDCIFFLQPSLLKECCKRSSKQHAVWVIPYGEFVGLAKETRRGSFDAAIRVGTVLVVRSQSVDGARMRLVQPLPFHGNVVLRLLPGMFQHEFM